MTFPPQGAVARVRAAAIAWLDGLDPGQRAKATFPFDSNERFVWAYVPGPREGLSLGEMDATQRAAAFAVAEAGLSERGVGELRSVIALEPILGALERATGRAGSERRDPDRYWFAIFGAPGASPAPGAAADPGAPDDPSPWSWRVGGHHVALQLTVADGRVIASAPSFLGANPATVPSGPSAGHRAIDGEERLARIVLDGLSPRQRGIAVVDPIAPPDIHSGSGRRARLEGIPSGIRYDDLASPQRADLERLIRHYLGRATDEVAEAEWARIESAGLDTVTFAWAGPDALGQGHYYAIRGPGFLVEYDNTQNDANHIHSVWRDLSNDWGEDLLAAHYRGAHPGR